jgi:hypothetical protein
VNDLTKYNYTVDTFDVAIFILYQGPNTTVGNDIERFFTPFIHAIDMEWTEDA